MGAIHQPSQALRGIPGHPGMQGLAGDPELGRHHHLRFTALDRQHGTVALLDNRQLDQSQSRPPITLHTGRCGVPPTFRIADLIRSVPEWRGMNVRTAQEIYT
jgi:hypothetical protein